MRSYNYVADCVAGLLTVLINGEPGEAYNLANPESRLTIAQLAAKIAKAESKKLFLKIQRLLRLQISHQLRNKFLILKN